MKTDPTHEKKREKFDAACDALAAMKTTIHNIQNETTDLLKAVNKERYNLEDIVACDEFKKVPVHRVNLDNFGDDILKPALNKLVTKADSDKPTKVKVNKVTVKSLVEEKLEKYNLRRAILENATGLPIFAKVIATMKANGCDDIPEYSEYKKIAALYKSYLDDEIEGKLEKYDVRRAIFENATGIPIFAKVIATMKANGCKNIPTYSEYRKKVTLYKAYLDGKIKGLKIWKHKLEKRFDYDK